MKHRMESKHTSINSAKFCPFEDNLGIVHDVGFSSILIPGAVMASFDSYEANPFETLGQRREKTVHGLLEKLDPATISFKIDTIG